MVRGWLILLALITVTCGIIEVFTHIGPREIWDGLVGAWYFLVDIVQFLLYWATGT